MLYIGVSAGSIIAANNLQNNLGYVNCILSVHCKNGSPCGTLNECDDVYLTDEQAVWITDDDVEVIK